MELSQRVRTNLLFDFYGSLLTKRQKKFVKLYFCDDLSLGEIAQRFRISRQAVYDTLKKAKESLEEYERKLNLADAEALNKQRRRKTRENAKQKRTR